MKLGSIVSDLQCHQARALRLLSDVEPMLRASTGARDPAFVVTQRPIFDEMLTAYQAFIHGVVSGPLAIGEDCPRWKRAVAIKADCIALGTDYVEFTRRWSNRDATDHWPEYRLSAIRMIRLIRRRFDFQQQAVAEMLAI